MGGDDQDACIKEKYFSGERELAAHLFHQAVALGCASIQRDAMHGAA